MATDSLPDANAVDGDRFVADKSDYTGREYPPQVMERLRVEQAVD